MKRIGLSLGISLAALLLGVAAPSVASAASFHGGGGHVGVSVGHGGGWHGAAIGHAAPMGHGYAAAGRGWSAPMARGYAPAGRGWGAPVGRGYAPYASVGHWGYRGATRVWIGAPTVRPYAGWIWVPGQWAWDGYQWVWQDGYWAPPV